MKVARKPAAARAEGQGGGPGRRARAEGQGGGPGRRARAEGQGGGPGRRARAQGQGIAVSLIPCGYGWEMPAFGISLNKDASAHSCSGISYDLSTAEEGARRSWNSGP